MLTSIVTRGGDLVFSLLLKLRKLSAWALLLGGAALVAGSWTVAALTLDHPRLAVGLAGGGSLLAGILLTVGVLALVETKAAEKSRLAREFDAAEHTRLLRERDAHIAEIRRLSSMRISTDAASPELRLGLLKVPFSLTDVSRRPVGSEHVEGTFIKDRHTYEYLGARTVRGVMHLGVDLQKVRVRRRSATEVDVYGLECDIPAISRRETEHLFSEVIDTVTDAKDGELKRRVLVAHDARESVSREHDAELERRLNAGADFSHLHHEVLGRSLVFIRTILAPLGVEVRLGHGDAPASAPSLTDFIHAENRALDARLESASARLKSLDDHPGPFLG